MNDRGIIVQAITGYVKNNKGHVIEIGRSSPSCYANRLTPQWALPSASP